MRKIILLLFLPLIIVSCKKDPIDKTDFPYEDSNIKLECFPIVNVNTSIVDLGFIDESNGIIISYYGKVFMTNDKGISWNLKYSPSGTNEFFNEVLFLDDKIAYVVGTYHGSNKPGNKPQGGFVLKTEDAGQTWKNILEISGSVEFESIAKNSKGDIFIVQSGYLNGKSFAKILKTADEGLSWSVVDSVNYPLLKITFSGSFGFCYGGYNEDYAKILRSIDNGKNWNETIKVDGHAVNDIQFYQNTGCYILNNSIYRTLNFGATWLTINSPAASVSSIIAIGSNSYLVCGATKSKGINGEYLTGSLYQTLDGGKSWFEHKIKDIRPLRKPSFFLPNQGYALMSGKLVKITIK